MTKTPDTSIFPSWPVVVALAIVGALISGMVALDVRLGRQVSNKTDEIIDNTQTSIVLIDLIRARSEQLTRHTLDGAQRAALVQEIAGFGRDYDPLTTSPGEAKEWAHLKALVAALSTYEVDDQARRDLSKEIDASADRLVAINVEEGHVNAASIRGAHRDALRDDLVAGGIALVIVGGIGVVLLRLLARQRRLVTAHLQGLADMNRELDAFAGRAAHDLRSPMNPIRGYSDLLLESPGLSDDAKKMARRIRTSVDRMAKVVDDMLALSTAGRPHPGACSTPEIVAAVVEELGPELHGVELTTEVAPSKIACSGGLLNQLLRNLIGNAIKYRADSRPLKVKVSTRSVEPMIELVVEDNGQGMDAETAAHAFEPMFRGRPDLETPGHGLGLAIVERIVRASGGTCSVSSALDQGTRIAIQLPRAA